MSEKQLELTSKEYHAAINAANRATGDGWRDAKVVDAILNAINEVRAPQPDPLVTIRKRPNGNLHAVRVATGWLTFNPKDGYHSLYRGEFPDATWDGVRITDWPLVYEPKQVA